MKKVKKELVFCENCEYDGSHNWCRFSLNSSIYTGSQKLGNFDLEKRYKHLYNLKGDCKDYLKKFQLRDLYKKFLELLTDKQEAL